MAPSPWPRPWNVLTHPGGIDLASLLTGLAALAILAALVRTRLAVVSALIALAIPTIIVVLAGADSVARVGDSGAIPRGVPCPTCPISGCSPFSLVTGALAVAAIVLVQGAGVAEAAPNEDGTASDANRDIIAQGVGNLASGFFRGLPVGGSVGQTAINVSAGGRTRWAAIWSGIWMLVILALFSGLVAKVAMPTLGAILSIFAAIGSLRPGEIVTIWRTGPTSQIAVVTTFAATLFLPVAAAVGIGVALSLLLQLNTEAMDLTVVGFPARRWPVRRAPSPGHTHQPARHGHRCVSGRRPAVRRVAHPASPPARPSRDTGTGGGAATPRPYLARSHLHQGGQRLRRPPR